MEPFFITKEKNKKKKKKQEINMPVINCCPYTWTTCLNQIGLQIQYVFCIQFKFKTLCNGTSTRIILKKI